MYYLWWLHCCCCEGRTTWAFLQALHVLHLAGGEGNRSCRALLTLAGCAVHSLNYYVWTTAVCLGWHVACWCYTVVLASPTSTAILLGFLVSP